MKNLLRPVYRALAFSTSFASRIISAFLLLFFTASYNSSFAQTAITAINTTYNAATTGTTYTTTGAANSTLSGNTYTYNFGTLSGSTNNSRQLNNFTAGGSTFSFVTLPGQYVKIRRVDNAVVTGIRSLRYSEGLVTGSTVNIVNEYNDDMESFFNGNTNFNSGSDNLFANQGDGNGNNNNIERLDVIFPSGVSASDNTKFGFSVFERGAQGAHDPIKVAVILAVDGSGNPTSYSSIVSLVSTSYGTTDPVAAADYVISRRENATETNLKVSTTTNQQIAGVFVKISDFAIANNTTIYGYSIIPNDFTGSTSADIIAYNNATLYPTNTSSATGTGGIDLVSATGVFQSGSVINRTISGNIFNDINGLTNSLVDGTGTNAGALNAILVNNTTGLVVNSIAVTASGTYTFGSVANATYTVRISTTAGTISAVPPAVLLPSGWVLTGEGTTTAGDGTVNGITNAFVFSGGTTTNVNFGVEQTATPSIISATSQQNPGGTTAVTVAAATFGATDPSSGTINSIRISAFPTNTTTITINGTSYNSGTFPGGGVSVPTNTSGQPTQTITLDPVDGGITSVITYYATDNAGKESSVTGTASLPFTLTVSGNVYNDVNGLSNSLVDGTGTNASGVNAILVNSLGNVVASAAVAVGGSYSFAGITNGSYTVQLSTTAGTVGSVPPAVSLPAGWVSTGEGTAAAGDGTVDGTTNTFTVSTVNVTNVNFGIEQTPTPSTISAASQVNPGGTTAVTVAAATFGATDPSSGTIASIRISAFPTNTTTITINGTSYTSGTFPGGGVSVPTNTSGQPTQTITLDPVDGAITSVITYYATDNAGKESTVTGTASLPFTTVTVSGNVYNDVNGLTNALVDGSGTNAGGINAILVDNITGFASATIAVAAGGTYTFPSVNGGTYTVRLSTTAGTIGAAPPAVLLPAGWVNTGEGTAAAGDGTVNGITNTFVVTNANIAAVNFGIEQTPTPSTIIATSQVNPGGTTTVTVAAATFGATDPSSGTIASIRISAFPTNTTTITINGTSYTSGTFPGGGVSVPTNTSGQPTQTITLDPVDGAITSVITYYATDNAGKESTVTGTASLPFTTVTVSGNVYNDVNGLTNALVDGSGTNAGGINAILVDNITGFASATIAVAAGGTYTFPSVNGGTYTVRLSTTAGTVGAAPPAVLLPAGWVNTGEGTAAAGDGTVNGITNTFTVTSANITNVNFGVEQTPTPSTISAASQVNPGGTTAVTVAAATFGATDPSSGTINSIRISAFPTNTTTITINGSSYTSGTFPGGGVSIATNTSGQPTQTITLDPVDGAITSVITYYATDNAGKESTVTGTASLPFTTVTVSGNVYNDVNGLTNALVDGSGTNAGTINAILVDNTTGFVSATIAVAAGGTYSFSSVNGGTYTVRLSTTAATIGAAPPALLLPAGWVSTGEGTAAAGDGTVDGITNTFTVTSANITNVNFGIEQTATPSIISATSQVNPGGTTTVTVAAATFGATDPSSGTINSIRISAFPTNTTTITINGSSYTSGTFPGGGVSVPTNTSGQPTQTITLDPIDGAITSVITYYATDNAGKESSVTGTASLPFTTVTVSGNVYNDVNGLTNALVDGSGTNAGGINAILVDNTTGFVSATIAVAAGGTYTFPSVNGGTYTVRLSTTAATIGAAPPALLLPAGWVNTGEGTAAAGDGTVDGTTNTFTVSTVNVTNVNFGIEQTATPSIISATSQVNPGGTTTVTVAAATFGATDPSSGTINSIRISAFPTNTTTITINGSSYTSGTFPGGGLSIPTNTSGQPTQTITLDPIDGAITSVITYYATDNASKESSVTGTASLPFTTVTVGGNVYNDVNGLTNALVDGSGTNAGAINAILVDNTTGFVSATIAVAAGGTYSFSSVNGGTYTVRLSTTAGTVGIAPPAVILPSGWVSTGEGTAAAGDGTVNGITNTFTVTSANIAAVNFGIEQTPTPSTISAASQVNPGGTTTVTVAAATFGATDPSSGTINSIRISAFPTNTTTITINGSSYTSGTFPGGGLSIPTNTSGQPTQTITLDPIDGAITSVITYYATDNASKESSFNGTVSMPFTTVTVSGNVYNDVNGLTNALVDGTGTNAGGVNAILVDNTTGFVSGTIAVAAGGTYTFPSVNGGTYTVRLSTTAGTVGAAPPAILLPAGWVSTGEGTAAAGDGTVDGTTNTFTVSTVNVTAVNFGIEQTPTPSTISAASQVNPGGTTAVTVAAASFGATDPSSGTIASIRINAFPTNTTTITINGSSYTSGTFPFGGVSIPTNTSGQPTQTITLDPIDGAITSVITYYATDYASKESTVTGTASLPFTTVTVSGNVYNDVNGLTNSLVDGTGTNAGGVNAILVDNITGFASATIAVAAGGTYTFPSVNGGTYTVRLSTTAGTIGAAPPAVLLPAGWVNTGEGTAAAGDGTVDGTTNTFTVSTVNVTNVNFGIEQTPTPSTISAASQVNPGGTTAVTVAAATFGATDPSSGTIASIRISAFPTNTTTITINGTSYTSGTFPGGGVSIPTNTSGQPTQTITLDPVDGAITSVITYYATDNASKESSVTGTASLPFTTITISGNVFNDLNKNIVAIGAAEGGETVINGTNAGGGTTLSAVLYVNLISTGGIVLATAPVQNNGTYNLSSVPPNTSGLILQLTSNQGVVGVAKPVTNIPAGWSFTGENKNGQAGIADALVNGEIVVTTGSSSTTAQNFGVALRDTDGDGIPDLTDIDDDNDGITDVIENGGFDPLADTDGDGTSNYLDATPGAGQPAFADVNGDGVNDFYDADKDGIINEMDLDTDNDGIADLVEAGGIDTNGDGIIDNLTDTDGDGLMNTYDITNGGVNIANLDTDGDGVPNYKDLDSDNDGIPDVVEAGGTDANNDGLIDSFTDTDSDGFSDNVDGDVGNNGVAENTANALIITSATGSTPGSPATYPKANADGNGLPNPYDLDSDGDGITDATESGITAVSFVKGMTSGCTLVDGWCITINNLPTLVLANSDGNGKPDLYDIDADNDGISDNIESQSTSSYVVAADTDSDGDGIADVYDFYNGMGGNGITPYDHDGDGVPDYIDTDSDNDGAPDRNEADKNNASLSQVTIDAYGDSDGDGMLDVFDIFNLSTANGVNVFDNVSNSNFGPSGNYNGPNQGGSNVSMVQSVSTAINRDWRNVSLLPLNIISFTGLRANGVAQLNWSVVNEQQVVHYVIENSVDGSRFDSIAVVASWQRIAAQYTFTDYKHPQNTSAVYYRIKQVNKSGSVFYTHIVRLKQDVQTILVVTLWPIPVENVLHVKIQLPTTGAVNISVSDITGKMLMQQREQGQYGDNNFQLLHMGKVPTGTYIVKVCTDYGCYSQRIVKK